MRTGAITALAAAAAIAVTGCGGGGGGGKEKGGGGGAQPVQGLTLPPESADPNVKPVIPKPKGPPPGGLQSRDLLQGPGKAAESGDRVSVQYVGVSWSSGQEF